MVRMADLSRSQGQKLTWMISYYAGRVEVPCVQEIDPNTSTHMTMVDCLGVYTQVSAHPGHVTPISCQASSHLVLSGGAKNCLCSPLARAPSPSKHSFHFVLLTFKLLNVFDTVFLFLSSFHELIYHHWYLMSSVTKLLYEFKCGWSSPWCASVWTHPPTCWPGSWILKELNCLWASCNFMPTRSANSLARKKVLLSLSMTLKASDSAMRPIPIPIFYSNRSHHEL